MIVQNRATGRVEVIPDGMSVPDGWMPVEGTEFSTSGDTCGVIIAVANKAEDGK